MHIASRQILALIQHYLRDHPPPIVLALDGGSGAGKSTLAALLARDIDAVVVPLDDFFSAQIPDWEWDTRSIPERARDVFDWQHVRIEALLPLRAGQKARWHPFDFVAGLRDDGTYGLSAEWVERQPAPVIILEGAYSSSPQLADLLDLTALVDVEIAERHRRLASRENPEFIRQWHERWDAVEAYYFGELRPKAAFDLVLASDTFSSQKCSGIL